MKQSHITKRIAVEAEEISKDGYFGKILVRKGDFLVTIKDETYHFTKELFNILFQEFTDDAKHRLLCLIQSEVNIPVYSPEAFKDHFSKPAKSDFTITTDPTETHNGE